MNYDEYQLEAFKTWRKKLFKFSIIGLIVLIVSDLSIFTTFILVGEIKGEEILPYFFLRVLTPILSSSLMILISYLGKRCSKSEENKNFHTLLAATSICGIVAIFHNYYIILFALPTLSVIASISFGNRKLIIKNFICILVFLNISFFTFAYDKMWKDDKVYVFTTIFVILVFYICVFVYSFSLATVHKGHLKIAQETLVEQNRLIHRLRTDSLTGLYNKSYLIKCLEESIDSDNTYFTLFDLDNFKKINDTYGHLSGDIVLQKLSQVIQNNTTKFYNNDESIKAFRFGGDEFSFIAQLNNKEDEKKYLEFIEGVRTDFEKCKYAFNKDESVTLSIGITKVQKEDTADSIFERGDKLMYLSKENGKNCYSKDF